MELKDSIVDVWGADMNVDSVFLKTCFAMLAPDEVNRAGNYRFNKDRDHFIARRGILRSLIGDYLNYEPRKVQFAYGAFGKPFVIDQPLYFNLTHSKDQVIFAFSRETPLGIDMELIKDGIDYMQVADHFFAPGEVASLRKKEGIDLRQSFYRCWTRKEAFIKANGDGLSFPLNQFEVSLKPNEQEALIEIRDSSDNVPMWTINNLNVRKDFFGALAYKNT